MTAPIAHGYPDFGRFQATADKILDNLVGQVINGTNLYGPYFVGDVDCVRIKFLPQTNNFGVVLRYYDSAALTNLLSEDSFSCFAGDLYNQSTPALGPYLSIRVTPSAAASIFDMGVFTSRGPWRPIGNDPKRTILFQGDAVAHPAGTTLLDANLIAPGAAEFYARCSVAGLEVNLQAVEPTGAVYHLGKIASLENTATRSVFLPPMHIQLRIANGTGAPALFGYSVTTRPGLLG